ncbi:hypothetical protein ACKWTF_004029 [Chironomus riparius]
MNLVLLSILNFSISNKQQRKKKVNITFLTLPQKNICPHIRKDILLVNVQSNKNAEIKTNGEEKEIGRRILKRNRIRKKSMFIVTKTLLLACLNPISHILFIQFID